VSAPIWDVATSSWETFRERTGARISRVLGGIVPVVVVERQYSEREQAQSAGFGQRDAVAGENSSISITANRDIWVRRIDYFTYSTVGINFGIAVPVHLFTPIAPYIPFLNNVAVTQPRLFSRRNLSTPGLFISGTNPVRPPQGDGVFMWNINGQHLDFNEGLGLWQRLSDPMGTTWKFDPPLFLPAGQFYTLQVVGLDLGIICNWWFTEENSTTPE